MEPIGWQIVLNFLAVHLVVWMEHTKRLPGVFTWIQQEQIWIRRGVIAFVSALTAAGLVFHFEVQTGDFILQGNAWSLLHALQHVGTNYAGITGMYWVRNLYDFARLMNQQIKDGKIVITPKP